MALIRNWCIKKLNTTGDNEHNISSLDPVIENTTYKKFNFHPKYNHKFQKVFMKFNITLAISNRFNIKNLIQANTKDKDPPNKKSGIYKVNCEDCSKCYIGQIRRNIETRMKEHCRNIKCFQIDKSAVAAHSWENGHHIDNNIKLIKHIIFHKDLNVWKKIYIQKNKFNVMNFDIQVENSLITKYIQPLKEGKHEILSRVHSNVHRVQAGEHQKEDVNRGLSQAVRKLADDGKDVS